ncbi:probable glutathione peroxidase 5 isoform X2 [Syzygium oleosum]|uniref:probable glutathione peroxidase 5 isoform X2 n=1 Tax=Syzygium oleosum TaxID=219896 RepID=UPI0024BB6180|nr:probable glutathione peroxidase 5 isoform X2 [Syzygium oleosum]
MGAAQSADEKSLHEFVVKVGGYTRSFASGSGISRSRRSRFTVGSRDVLMWVLMMVVMTMQDSKGDEVYLRAYEGKVLLVVNVASNCGFTKQNYTQLTELHNRYKDKGFEILAFPCNQFLGQEPTTSQEVQKFACDRYKVEFPIFQKVCVNGQETAPLYKYLKARKTGFFGSRIKWNFTKFLIDKEGRVISRYGTTTPPLAIEEDIQKALGVA